MALEADLERLLREFTALLALRLAPTTCKGVRVRLWHFIKQLLLCKKDYVAVCRQDIEQYLVNNKWSHHTRQTVLHSIKGFYDYLLEKCLVTQNPAEKIHIRSPRRTQRLIQVPPVDKIRKILHQMERDKSPAGLRDRLMVELAYGSGLRRSEIATLNIEDIDRVNRTVHVLGKGRKERVAPLTGRCLRAFEQYLQSIDSPRKYLLSSNQTGTRLGPAAVGAIIKAKTGFNAHLFRHACATHMLLAGCSIRYIQELLGHERTDTTQIYTNLNKEQLREIIERLHPARKRFLLRKH